MYKRLITVFTPSYNRAYCLSDLYQSLIRQTSKNFLWHIVDDGSTDNTEQLVKSFMEEGKIEIRYDYQENSGKHVAHNTGVLKCETELFVCVDSDDYLTDDAVEIAEREWNKIEPAHKLEIAGLVADKCWTDGKIIGVEFPEIAEEAGLLEWYKLGKQGDTTLVYRAEVLKEFLFPVFEGERFLREHVCYWQIDKKYKLRAVRKNMCVCEYRNDGLSANAVKHEFQSPRGAAFGRFLEYEEEKRFYHRVRKLASYVLFSIVGKDFKGAVRKIGIFKTALMLPVAGIGYIRYKCKERTK